MTPCIWRNMGWLDWDDFAREYDAVFLEDPVYLNLLEEMIREVGDAASGSVLDLGCGTGNATFQLLRASPGAEVLAVDPSLRMRELSAERFKDEAGVTVEEGDGNSIPAGDGTFDVVMSSLTLHHVPRERKAGCARELARVLKPGGRLVYADRFCDVDGPPGDPGRARDMLQKLVGWALYLLDHGATRKMMMVLESIPNDLKENGEYVVTAGEWLDHLAEAGFEGTRVTGVEPVEFGLKVLSAKRA